MPFEITPPVITKASREIIRLDNRAYLDPAPKLYIPSTLNIALLQWHTHLNVCAVK